MIADMWADRWQVSGAEALAGYVMVFENQGEGVGATFSYPHGQICGYPKVLPRSACELAGAELCVHRDTIRAELADGRRVVALNGRCVAWAPFLARFPYEVHFAPPRHLPSLAAVDLEGRESLAEMPFAVARGHEVSWGSVLPYVMAVQLRPTSDVRGWDPMSQPRVDSAPPSRSWDRLKFLAGSELAGGSFTADVAPEAAAGQLRAALATVTR